MAYTDNAEFGAVAASWTSQFLTSLLFDIAPTDVRTLAGVAVALLLVGASAAWLPARRAAWVDPRARSTPAREGPPESALRAVARSPRVHPEDGTSPDGWAGIRADETPGQCVHIGGPCKTLARDYAPSANRQWFRTAGSGVSATPRQQRPRRPSARRRRW